MTKEEAYKRMMEYKGKCDYCPLRYPECANTNCPSDEELKKEVEEYISYRPTEGTKDFVVYKVKVGENAFVYVIEHKNELYCSDWIKIYEGTEPECYRVIGYLDSAEPREKKIKELEDRLTEVVMDAGRFILRLSEKEEEIAELRKALQIVEENRDEWIKKAAMWEDRYLDLRENY